jgi:ubiquinone/menaquinone biosynthesis C-methylase UbiE
MKDLKEVAYKMNKTFDAKVSSKWDNKEEYVSYYGYPNPITKLVLDKSQNKISIIDIGCGTGKLIEEIDKKVEKSNIVGLDISRSMIMNAKQKEYTGRNNIEYICEDFLDVKLHLFDLVIMKNFLHHTINPEEYLRKAVSILKDNGELIFSVPSLNYLKELFLPKELNGRFNVNELNKILSHVGLFPLSVNINRVAMTYSSYEACIEYLKSIGTYAKIIDYADGDWNKHFDELVHHRFNRHSYITGEYLTYDCINKNNVLVKRKV